MEQPIELLVSGQAVEPVRVQYRGELCFESRLKQERDIPVARAAANTDGLFAGKGVDGPLATLPVPILAHGDADGFGESVKRLPGLPGTGHVQDAAAGGQAGPGAEQGRPHIFW